MNEQTCVAAGARWLDQEIPDWYHRIDTMTLDLHSGRFCVLGQLFGHYCNVNTTIRWNAAHGFTWTGTSHTQEELEACWLQEINQRREHDPAGA